MKFDSESNKIFITDDELAAYAYQRENPDRLMKHFGFIKDDPNRALNGFGTSQSAVPLEKEIAIGKYIVVVQAYADIITYDGLLYTVETIDTVRYFHRNLTPFSNPENFAKAIIRTYMFSDYRNLPEIKTKITFIKESGGEKTSFLAKFTKIALTRMFDALIGRAHTFLINFGEYKETFPAEIEALPFPYHSIRESQEIFIKSAFRTIKRGELLLVSAPTGIGKTVSALYPAVKALEESVDKIFYFTAKNVTGKAALETIERLSKYAPHLNSISIIAKEQICPLNRASGINGRVNCRHCERLMTVEDINSGQMVSYREREIAALASLIELKLNVYTPDIVLKVAEDFLVCPYELSLDLSEFCRIIVCDYNYVIDDNVRFKRYFKDTNHENKYTFLFDEAHNLPDRARNTYSAIIKSSLSDEMVRLSENEFSDDHEFIDATKKLKGAFELARELCRENEYFKSSDSGEVIYGFYEDRKVPEDLLTQIKNVSAFLGKYLREESDYYEQLEGIYHQLSKAVFVCSFFDNRFKFFVSRENDKVSIELLCIDPSGIIEKMLEPAKSVIMFSATLSPIEYYRDVIGARTAQTLELDSPYDPSNLCLVAYDSISTKLNDRRDTSHECAEVIAEVVSEKVGNYIVYFPSYDYMKRVCKLFARIMPDCDIVMQRQGMSYKERDRFINLFRDKKRGAIVGFCVLGGMFSEGIDLAGESLIGTIIVGTGMPSLSAERNIMEMYYNEENGRGHEFAYICPGINKVLQAAGRVIRTENDRGVVVFIDERYADPGIKVLLPKHFRHIKYTGDLTSLSAILSDFWGNKK